MVASGKLLLIAFVSSIFLLGSVGYTMDKTLFATYLGNQYPLLVLGGLMMGYVFAYDYLESRQWHFISSQLHRRLILPIFISSAVLGCVPILIDLWKPFDEEINVLFPLSLVFYPTVGMVAEIVFHLVPLVLILHFLPRIKMWFLILSIALVEPIFQVIFEMQTNNFNLKIFIVATEVFAFNVFQLLIFRRYGFSAMYLARLGFYTTWHIIWGYYRLLM